MVDVDFNDSSTACPSGFREDIDSIRIICVKGNDGTMSCTSIEYSVSGIAYSSVCGKVIAYHAGWNSRSVCTFDCPPRFPDHRLSVAILIMIVVHVT